MSEVEAEEGGAEEVVVRLASMPQLVSGEGGTAGGGGARAATSAGVELGRRLLVAARNGDTRLLLELMAQGAPFTTDWLGTSALHLAALGGHGGACGVLLRAGVSRDARTKVERTPLHLAAHAGHEPVARLLLDHGAAVDCRDMLRMTPLHWACARGHAALAALLVRRGADPRARCKFGRSALQLAAPHPDVRRALRTALRERDQAASVRAIQEEMAVDEEPEQKYEGVQAQAPPEEKPTLKIPPKINKPNLDNEGRGGGGGAAALLRQHGITLLPADDGGTVLSALQSGRTVVLSDAGKLMLKENSTPATPATVGTTGSSTAGTVGTGSGGAGGAGAGAGGGARSVVVRARPARGPPRPGVKVFTLNTTPTRLTSTNTTTNTDTDNHLQQVKYVQLPADATILSPQKAAMKAKTKLTRPVGTGPGTGTATGAGTGASSGNRPGVKIIMNKASFSKLLATASRAHGSGDNEPLSLSGARGSAVVCVPEQFVRSSSARYLRAQLLAAHAALAELQRELRQARDQLQQGDNTHG